MFIQSADLWIFVYTGRSKYGIIPSNDFRKIRKIFSVKQEIGYCFDTSENQGAYPK